MPIDIRIHIDLTPRQKRVMRAAVVTGTVIAALGIGVAIADINTGWIVDGGMVSASSLKTNLDGLQAQIDDGGMSLQGQIATLQGAFSTLQAAHNTETAGGTYSMGAVFCTATTTPVNGAQVGGYSGAKQACQAACGGAVSAHMCTADELVRTRQLGLAITFTTGNAWYSSAGMSYFPSNSAYMNDCVGWTANGSPTAYNGSAWLASLNCPGADSCAASHPILCCN